MKRILNLWCAVVLLAGMSVAAADSGIVSRNFVPAGANVVTRSMQDKLRESVSLDDYTSLAAAIAALPAEGGVVNVPAKRYRAGVWGVGAYMNKANVTIRGVKMPSCSASCDRLVGGSIIEGRFVAFADNFTVEDIGFDAGKYVTDTYFGGADTHSPNHPDGGGWEAFNFAQPNTSSPLPPAKNFRAKNVIGLLRDSKSYGHAMLLEAIDGGVVDNIVGVYGIHALVIKSKNIKGGVIAGYAASANHVIFKSDAYAEGGNISIDTVDAGFAPPGKVLWSTPAQADYGLLLNPATANMGSVKIGKLRVSGATQLIRANGTTSDRILDNVMIESAEIEGLGAVNSMGILFQGAKFRRIHFGHVTIVNVADGIAYEQLGGYGDEPIVIDSLNIENAWLRAVNASGYGRFIVNSIRAINVGTMYTIADTARVHIGYEGVLSYVTKWGLNPPVLTSGWKQLSGGALLDIRLNGYGVELKGDVAPMGTPSANVMFLPPYLRSSENSNTVAMGKNGAGANAGILISQGGTYGYLAVNGGISIVGAESSLSLSGIKFRND